MAKKPATTVAKAEVMPALPEDDLSESIVEVDLLQLHLEWKRQAKLYFKYAMELANAGAYYAEKKAAVKEVMASVEQRIRKSPEDYDIDKVTDSAIKAAVQLHPEVKKVTREHIGAKYALDRLDGVISALDHRKKALENLVYLHGSNYFSEPQVKEGPGREILETTSKSYARSGGKKLRSGGRRRSEEEEEDSEEE